VPPLALAPPLGLAPSLALEPPPQATRKALAPATADTWSIVRRLICRSTSRV
jgi:hypothetical protein